MSEQVHEYSAPGITVTWEPGRCQHAAECVRGLPAVFDVHRRPWIDPDAEPAEAIAEVVDRCPSYALGYRTAEGRTRTAPSGD